MSKLSCCIYATILSQSPLPQPKIVPDRCKETGKVFQRKVTTFDQRDNVEIEFPFWPVEMMYINKAIDNMRAEVAKIIIGHIRRANAFVNAMVLLEPVVYEKLEKKETMIEVDKKHGFSFQWVREHEEHDLEGSFVRYEIPRFTNLIDTEIVLHKGIDNIRNLVISELNAKGIISC